MQVGQWRIRIDWGHLTFIAVICGLTGFYLAEVLSVSRHINNVILVQPFSILVIVLSILVVAGTIHFERTDNVDSQTGKTPAEKGDSTQTRADVIRSAVLLVGMGVYVGVYSFIGLDLSTFLFVAGALYLLGQRRLLFTLLYAAVFTVVIAGGARWMLPYPMPMLLF